MRPGIVVWPQTESNMVERVALRPARARDLAFCERLYFKEMGWIIEALRLDAAKQRESFPLTWRSEEVRVIVVTGNDVGWLQITSLDDTFFLAQLYLAGDFQRRGIGAAVLRMLFRETAPSGKAITLGVVKINPARRLYERLGFRATHEDEHKVYMRREPDQPGESDGATVEHELPV
jgi:ribosomal protein S18 acetylase RimI-like enzyme